ncbi:MAG: hypothetical protein ACRCXZ_00695 [Patescibacteria group bacterium]
MYTNQPTCIVASPSELVVELHQSDLFGRVRPYSYIRERMFAAWEFMQESISLYSKQHQLPEEEFFVVMEMYNLHGKFVDQVELKLIIETVDVLFTLLLARDEKSMNFSNPLQQVEYPIKGGFQQLSRLTFTNSPMSQNYNDLLRYGGQLIFKVELKLYCKKEINLYEIDNCTLV